MGGYSQWMAMAGVGGLEVGRGTGLEGGEGEKAALEIVKQTTETSSSQPGAQEQHEPNLAFSVV